VADNTDAGVSVEALARAGLRGRVYQEVFGIEPEPDDATILRELTAKLEAHRQTLQRYEASERITLGVAPHAIYTVRDSLMRAVRQYAREESLPLSIHAAESSEEVALARAGSGSFAEMFVERKIAYLHPRVPPIEYLHNAGVLASDVQLVHATRAEPRELEMMARAGVSVAHCPRSNARLLTGIAPVYGMRRLGIPIALGTDSAVSAGNLDLWEELRFGALAQRAVSYAASPTWRDWVRMLTLDGAKAFGVDTQIGSLEAGKRADVIAVRTPSARVYLDARPLHRARAHRPQRRCRNDDGRRTHPLPRRAIRGAGCASVTAGNRAVDRDSAFVIPILTVGKCPCTVFSTRATRWATTRVAPTEVRRRQPCRGRSCACPVCMLKSYRIGTY
jgi:cytosine/adenosine deaminase-related metal-dependent hydrolase